MTLPAFAAERRRRLQLSIDISCRSGRSAANPPAAVAVVDRTGANYIQGGDADVSCSAWFRTTLLGVVIHMCRADMPHQHRLRSASTEQLDVPTCRRSTIGGRAFPVAGAKVWNGLPSDVTSASSLPVFKNRLKTYFSGTDTKTV